MALQLGRARRDCRRQGAAIRQGAPGRGRGEFRDCAGCRQRDRHRLTRRRAEAARPVNSRCGRTCIDVHKSVALPAILPTGGGGAVGDIVVNRPVRIADIIPRGSRVALL